MAQWVLTPKDFLTGMSISDELGGLWADQQAIDVERSGNLNTVGALRSGQLASSLGTMGVLHRRTTKFTQGNVSAAANAGTLGFFVGSLSATRVDTQNILAGGVDAVSSIGFTASAFNNCDLGIGYLSSVSGGNMWVAIRAATASAVDRLVQLDTLSGNFSYNEPAAGSAFAGIGTPHPPFLKNNILWWPDGNQVAKLTTDTGLTLNVLDLPTNYTITSISEYDKYLAIGATERNSTRSIKSKLFLWDMISDSWNFDFSIPDAIRQLVNENGQLYIYTSGQAFSILRFNGAEFKKVHAPRNALYSTLQPSVDTDFVDLDRGKHFISLNRTDASSNNSVDVWSYKSYLPLENEPLQVPQQSLSALTGTKVAGALLVGDYNKIYQSYQDGSTFGLSVFKTGNYVNAECTTRELDSYFGGNGALKKMNWMRFEFDRINTATDRVDIYDFVDNITSSSRLDGETAVGKENSIRNSDLGDSANSKTFMIGKQFREYKLRLIFVAGNVRIRKIVIDWDPVNVTGR